MYPNTSDMENSDKVTKALETLKLELMSIREQDVGLMKQLLKINDTLKSMSPKTATNKPSASSNCRNNTGTTSRRQSYLNHYFNKRRGSYDSSNGSLSSIEESASDESRVENQSDAENDSMFESEEDLRYKKCITMRRYSCMSECSSEDEHLLISNIKVWKYKQSKSTEELRAITNSFSAS